MHRRGFLILGTAAGLLGGGTGAPAQTDPLPAWNDGASKKAILDFVSRTTAAGGADFVPVDQRIATFDNDGTLWTEQPIYFQFAFAIDRVKALASQNPEWKDREPFKSVLASDIPGIVASGEEGLLEIVAAKAKVEFIDDGPGKPVGINRFIGRRPVFAFGNSDGDLQMLQYTAGGGGLRFLGLVHHTDAVREYAYDRQSPIGKLDKALDEALKRQWTVVDMKTEWNTIYPFERK